MFEQRVLAISEDIMFKRRLLIEEGRKAGMDEATILADFPELRHEHIQAVLAFAAERERRLSALPAVS